MDIRGDTAEQVKGEVDFAVSCVVFAVVVSWKVFVVGRLYFISAEVFDKHSPEVSGDDVPGVTVSNSARVNPRAVNNLLLRRVIRPGFVA